ncbi:MAG: hypothetical protein JNK78_18005 [Planctomycetes bacterium]|nr:hypothetical protein [Planctomycetota bacterium]
MKTALNVRGPLFAVALGITALVFVWRSQGAPPPRPSVPEATGFEESPPNSLDGLSEPFRSPVAGPVAADAIVAPSSAAPVLTLSGVLEKQVLADIGGSGKEKLSTPMTFGQALASKAYNPESKVLTVDEESTLAAVVQRQNGEDLEVVVEHGRVMKAALLRALAAGQVESILLDQAGPGVSSSEANHANTVRSKQRAEMLENRLGKRLVDWAYTVFWGSEPDGVARSNIVWFTKHQEPGVFEVRSRMFALSEQHQAELKQFFADIPRR